MSLHVELTKLSQDINLSNGEAENFIILELPNGGSVRARVNAEAAEAVMDCFVNKENASKRPTQGDEWAPPQSIQVTANGFVPATAPDGTDILEFGGSTTAPPRQPRPRQQPGYDPGEIPSSSDEDGVGQV